MDSEKYVLLSGDLAEFKPKCLNKLVEFGLDPNKATLYLFECVLIYISKEDVYAMLKTLSEFSKCAMIVIYEYFGLKDDPFSDAMIGDLKVVQLIHLIHSFNRSLRVSIHSFNQTSFLTWRKSINVYYDSDAICKSLEEQERRLLSTGWSSPKSITTKKIWDSCISPEEKNRYQLHNSIDYATITNYTA